MKFTQKDAFSLSPVKLLNFRLPIAWRWKAIRGLVLLVLTCILTVMLAHMYILPGRSQLIELPSELTNQTTTRISHVGNLDTADVKLDGIVLFPVGAFTPTNPDSRDSISPIQRRVKSIEFHLNDLVQDGFDPATLVVAPEVLNNQTVIVASDKKEDIRVIATVIDPDIQIAARASIDEVAQQWSDIVQKALLKAYRERQPEYMWAQVPPVLKRLALTGGISIVIFGLQKFRRARRQAIRLKQQALAATSDQAVDVAETIVSQPDAIEAQTGQSRFRLSRYWPRLSLSQQASLNRLVQPMLLAAQVSVWHLGIGSILHRFAQTRTFADWLIRVPLSLIAVPLSVAIAKQAIDFMILLVLKQRQSVLDESRRGDDRLGMRIETILHVMKEVTRIFAVLLGILLFFYLLEALQIALIIAAAIGFLSQDVLKDYIQTHFILLEDQYVLGDIITIQATSGNAIVGTVESITARVTKLRNLDGLLITVPHGNISEVANFTHQWSRVNLGIDVAYKTDLEQAMAVIKQVAQDMQHDPGWGEFIVEDPTVLGVDAFGDNSITIRLLIKTQPGKHRDIEREYRRRLKAAFDQAGIDIPFPQRSIWFENPLQAQN